MRKPHPDLFEDIPWSTETVLSDTLERAGKRGVKTDLLLQWNDLDTFEDLAAYYKKHKNRRPKGEWSGKQTFLFLSQLTKINKSIAF